MSFIGKYSPPGDKSISHRILIFSAISRRTCTIENLLLSDDTRATLEALRSMGLEINIGEYTLVKGLGLRGLKKPKGQIKCHNSATTMRLLAGLLVGQDFESVLVGDASLSKRPMKRLIDPLTQMGAKIRSKDGQHPPLIIEVSEKLTPIKYQMEVASAQVKSAIMIASLYTESSSHIIEDKETRNHTELILDYFTTNDFQVDKYRVPGDFSSAAFFIGGGVLAKGSEILIEGIGLNPTRIGFLKVLQRMGADIEVLENNLQNNELMGDILVKSSELTGTEVFPEEIPSMIDEIPILAMVAAFSHGETIIRGLGELRVKETDRLRAILRSLLDLGIEAKVIEDDLYIKGGKIRSALLDAQGDHRLEMTFEILKAISKEDIKIIGGNSKGVSYPDFNKDYNNLWRTK